MLKCYRVYISEIRTCAINDARIQAAHKTTKIHGFFLLVFFLIESRQTFYTHGLKVYVNFLCKNRKTFSTRLPNLHSVTGAIPMSDTISRLKQWLCHHQFRMQSLNRVIGLYYECLEIDLTGVWSMHGLLTFCDFCNLLFDLPFAIFVITKCLHCILLKDNSINFSKTNNQHIKKTRHMMYIYV